MSQLEIEKLLNEIKRNQITEKELVNYIINRNAVYPTLELLYLIHDAHPDVHTQGAIRLDSNLFHFGDIYENTKYFIINIRFRYNSRNYIYYIKFFRNSDISQYEILNELEEEDAKFYNYPRLQDSNSIHKQVLIRIFLDPFIDALKKQLFLNR